jgi:hypothetical protein
VIETIKSPPKFARVELLELVYLILGIGTQDRPVQAERAKPVMRGKEWYSLLAGP